MTDRYESLYAELLGDSADNEFTNDALSLTATREQAPSERAVAVPAPKALQRV
jgi:hypothetical protein